MATFHWKKAVSGSFNTAANWTPAGVPGSADAAVIDAVGTYTVGSSQNNTVEELDTIGTSTLAVNADTFEVTTVINNYGIVAPTTTGQRSKSIFRLSPIAARSRLAAPRQSRRFTCRTAVFWPAAVRSSCPTAPTTS
jgi:hypothetical protein